jgi:hypothetical protein|tara:strand:- start:2175 stop:2807 length:633 start_codon:yes stop_codon:yes gene_type:complete
MDWNNDGQVDNAELRLTGLILAQSALIGVAVGVFDSGIWLPAGDGDHIVNGMTYAMGALAVQILAYYVFKMFFEQSMKVRVNTQNLQREREIRLRSMQTEHEQRRIDMELRIQEMQLERELMAYKQNPSLLMQETITVPVPPKPQNTVMSLGLDKLGNNQQEYTAPRVVQNPGVTTLSLNQMADDLVEEEKKSKVRLKKDGTPDLRYKNN